MMKFCATLVLLVVVLVGGLSAGDGKGDAAWERIWEHQKKEEFGKMRKAIKSFKRNYPDDTRMNAEVEAMLDDLAFLGVSKLWDHGPRNNRINLVFGGDGYGVGKQQKFRKSAERALMFLVQEEPLNTYRYFLNADLLFMSSKSDKVATEQKEEPTAWKCKTGPGGQTTVPQGHAGQQVARHVPDWGLLIVIAQRGNLGSGYMNARISAIAPDAGLISYNSVGNSYFGLFQEYAGNKPFTAGEVHGPNLTTNPDKDKAPWAHWYGDKKAHVKFIPGGMGATEGVWHPTKQCIMQGIGSAAKFCAVCHEHMILKLHSKVKMVDRIEPDNTNVIEAGPGEAVEARAFGPGLAKGPFDFEWSIDGKKVKGFAKLDKNTGIVTYRVHVPVDEIPAESKILKLTLKDPTRHVKKDPQGLLNHEVSWAIKVTKATE